MCQEVCELRRLVRRQRIYFDLTNDMPDTLGRPGATHVVLDVLADPVDGDCEVLQRPGTTEESVVEFDCAGVFHFAASLCCVTRAMNSVSSSL